MHGLRVPGAGFDDKLIGRSRTSILSWKVEIKLHGDLQINFDIAFYLKFDEYIFNAFAFCIFFFLIVLVSGHLHVSVMTIFGRAIYLNTYWENASGLRFLT